MQNPSGSQSLIVYSWGQYWGQYCWTPSLMILDDRTSASSASLQTLEDWEEWLIDQMVMLPFRRISASWLGQLRGISWNLTKGNAKSCTRWIMSPHILLRAEDQLAGKWLYRKVSGSPGQHQLEHGQQCAVSLWHSWPTISWPALGALPVGWGRL